MQDPKQDPDPDLDPKKVGSGLETKSFRIHNTRVKHSTLKIFKVVSKIGANATVTSGFRFQLQKSDKVLYTKFHHMQYRYK
jgi:hypothetical protein